MGGLSITKQIVCAKLISEADSICRTIFSVYTWLHNNQEVELHTSLKHFFLFIIKEIEYNHPAG